MDNEYYESRNVISYEIPQMFPVQDQRPGGTKYLNL